MNEDASKEHDAVPWRHIVEDVADALIYIDWQGVIQAWNPAAAVLFGFSADEALGQHVDLIIPKHLRAAHAEGFDRAMERGKTVGGNEVRRTRGLHRDGRKLYVDMSFAVVKDDQGNVLGSAAMARDATAQHLAERAQREAEAGSRPT